MSASYEQSEIQNVHKPKPSLLINTLRNWLKPKEPTRKTWLEVFMLKLKIAV